MEGTVTRSLAQKTRLILRDSGGELETEDGFGLLFWRSAEIGEVVVLALGISLSCLELTF
jgi:hypothetical protein